MTQTREVRGVLYPIRSVNIIQTQMYVFKCIRYRVIYYRILCFISVCVSSLLKLNNAVSMNTLQVRCSMFITLCRNNNSHTRIQHKPFVLQIESQRRSVLHLSKWLTGICCLEFVQNTAISWRTERVKYSKFTRYGRVILHEICVKNIHLHHNWCVLISTYEVY